MTGSIRDLLLKHPYGGPEFGGCECGQIIGGAQDVWADHLAPIIADATTPRTITTAEELDALAYGSVVLDSDGAAWNKRTATWWWCGAVVGMDGDGMTTAPDPRFGPFTVLHEGARDE